MVDKFRTQIELPPGGGHGSDTATQMEMADGDGHDPYVLAGNSGPEFPAGDWGLGDIESI